MAVHTATGKLKVENKQYNHNIFNFHFLQYTEHRLLLYQTPEHYVTNVNDINRTVW
jgi:short subunit fatty acids transporter